MKLMKICLLSIMWSGFFLQTSVAQIKWYKSYEKGLKAVEIGDWNGAIKFLKDALKVKNKDKGKIRASGAIFISYYPHRELGICYYHLGTMDIAKQELQISLSQSFSRRAKSYIERIEKGAAPKIVDLPEPADTEDKKKTKPPPFQESSSAITQVGERLRIAILPFENKGSSQSIDLLDKLITVFVNIDRFKVLERARLEKVLEEHKLGMTGFIDATTAAEIGKGIGVDAVVTGSITWSMNEVDIDARFIDTETAAIISAQGSYSRKTDLKSLNSMLLQLASQFKDDLPVVNGYVINLNENKLTLDLGRANNIKKGMKCYVYREGTPIIHPVTKKVIGKMIDILCEIQLQEVYDKYSVGYIIARREGKPRMGDMVITK